MKRSGCLPFTLAFAGARFTPLLTLMIVALTASAPGLAAGSAEAGQAKAIVCTACHGVDGNSLNPEWPSIAGQNAPYIVRSLQSFKSGTRSNVLMNSQAMSLSDQDMQDLAAFFASRLRQGKTADPKLASAGERLYRGGNKETGVSACVACHGPNGTGNGPAAYPAIGGQHAQYTAAQLRAYRASRHCADKSQQTPADAAQSGDAQRCSDLNQMMRNNAARLTDDEINAVASYVQGLR